MVKAYLIQVEISVINEIKDLSMKTFKPVLLLVFASAIFVSSAGCDLVGMAIEEAIDCAFRMSAQLDGKTLPGGKVGELYDERLVASVKNTPNEHHFEYYFTFEGEFPPGIHASVSDRTVFLRGIPVAEGEYRVNIHVDIVYTGDSEDERYCFSDPSLTRTYTISIATSDINEELILP